MRRFKNILFVVTAGSDDDTALERATTLAENHQAKLSVVEVMEEIPTNLFRFGGTNQPDKVRERLVAEHRQTVQQRTASGCGKTGIPTGPPKFPGRDKTRAD